MKREGGFTLTELLAVIGILGVLAAVAIPQFLQYRAKGFDARAKMDLCNVATAEEAYYADYEIYLPCDQSSCTSLLPTMRGIPSPGVTLKITTPFATASNFTGTSKHSSSNTTFAWNSANGGLQP